MLNIRNIRIVSRYISNTNKNTIPNTPTATLKRKKGGKLRKRAFFGLAAFLTLLVFSNSRKKQMQFIMAPTQLNKKIVKKNEQLNKQRYIPTLYLPIGILQQLFAKYFQTHTFIKQKQQITQDCIIHYIPLHNKIETNNIKPSCAIVICGNQGYNQLITNTMLLLSSNQFQVIGINMKDIYNTQKLIQIVNKIKSERIGQIFHGVGVQYGANLLVMASAKNNKLFDSLFSLGNPLDIGLAQKNVQNSYTAKLTFLQSIIKAKINKSKLNIPANNNLYQLDKYIYKLKDQQQLTKFKNSNSSINYLNKLTVPTLFLNSKQDPLSIDITNDQRIQINPLCSFILTKHGGHNQWFYSMKAVRWAPRVIVSHVKNIDRILKNQGI